VWGDVPSDKEKRCQTVQGISWREVQKALQWQTVGQIS